MAENDSGKKVDEEWKRQAQQEKERLSEQAEPEPARRRGPLPEPTFSFLVSGLVSQTLMGMGQVPNPITGKQEKNLDDAKFAIDTLQMLKEKTRGNLTEDEKKQLDSVLYDLRMRFLDCASSQ
jgi:hypothetical protein